MATQARAFVQFEADGPLDLLEITLPRLRPHDIEVDLVAGGICHSQLNWMQLPRTGPILLGHEAVGRVRAVGSAVRKVDEGDAVLITWIADPEPAERTAEQSIAHLSSGESLGCSFIYTWADRTVVDEKFVLPLGGGATPDGSLSTLGCAVPTGIGAVMKTAGVSPGDVVVVIGAGGVGLSAIKGAQLSGAARIIAVDISDEKLTFAKKFGATDLVNSSTVDLPSAIHGLVDRVGLGTGADFVFDCVANQTTFSQAVASARGGSLGLRQGGAVVVVGYPMKDFALNATALLRGEKTILGSFGGSSNHDDLSRYLTFGTDGRFDLAQLVTDTFAFEDIPAGVEALKNGSVLGRAIYTI